MIRASGQQHAVPIHVWIKSIILAFLLFCGGFACFVLSEINEEDSTQANDQFEQIFTNILPNGQPADVCILGSSLTRCALPKFGTLDAAIEAKKTRLDYKIISRRKVVLSDFNSKIPGLQADKPKYLCIESNIMCLKMFENSKEIELTFNRLLIRYWSRVGFSPKNIKGHNLGVFVFIEFAAPTGGRKG